MYTYLMQKKTKQIYTHKDPFLQTQGQISQHRYRWKWWPKHFSPKNLKSPLNYKHISCKHFSKQLHHLCRLTVSHLAPPLPWGKIKKLCEAFNLFRYQAEQSSNSLQFNRHIIYKYMYCSLIIFYQKQMFMDWTVLSVYKNQKLI